MAASSTACTGCCAILGESLQAGLGRGLRSQLSLKQYKIAVRRNPVSVRAEFHGRDREMRVVEEQLRRKPNIVTLVLGPINSGKSALFREYIRRMEVAEKQSFIAVDCRTESLRSPLDLGRAFGVESFRWLQLLEEGRRQSVMEAALFLQSLKNRQKADGFPLKLLDIHDIVQKDVRTMADVTRYLGELAKAYDEQQRALEGKGSGKYPLVIFIDQANELAKISEDKKDLRLLFGFLQWLCNQKGLAHVVLATSDFAFESWLSKHVSRNYLRVVTIGDFVESDARSFFEKRAAIPVGDADWGLCYEALGGGPGNLIECADNYTGDNITEAIALPVQGTARDVSDAVEPAKALGYPLEAFLLVARAVLAAGGHCVPRTEILRLLHKQDPECVPSETLMALVKGKAVTVRIFSKWAFDIPATAFDRCGNPGKMLVMAPSPAHLYCWKEALPPHIQTWEVKEAADEAAAASEALDPYAPILKAIDQLPT